MGLTHSEYDRIVELMGREPNETELGMFAVMWSEHCGYKYSRPILAYFSEYKKAMEGAGLENAGIIPLDAGLGVALKVESHNHPSAVEPYQGAATGVGGIIRDIFTMGARPIASLNSLRFGPIHDGGADPAVVQRNRYLFEHVVAGIAGYGNCVGIPTVAGEVAFHPRYSGNPLVNAMSVGLVKIDEIATAAAAGPGNPVVYLGSATGKDGIHGATFASDVLGEDSEEKRPNVQIGDPFAEKLLIEATLEALRTGAIVAIQDMGAAGLTCSTIEMSAKGGVGMEVDLDLVPMRESDMTAYELMLSESQERMLAVAALGREQEVIDVFRKWNVHAVVIGHVVEGDTVTVRRHGKVEAQVVARHLADQCPTYTVVPEEPARFRQFTEFNLDSIPELDANEALKRLLTAPSLADKGWVTRQYDQQVQTQTAVGAGSADAAVLAPRGTQKGLAMKIDGNGRWVFHDPYVGGQLAVCEAARNVACTGARPAAATDGLNFGNPQDPNVYWEFDRCVKGIAEACEALGTPVLSGNVSFYNESELGEVLPTPLIGIVGILDRADRRLTMSWPAGDWELGLLTVPLEFGPHQGLGASSYLAEAHSVEDGRPVAPNLAGEHDLHTCLVRLNENQVIVAAHDVSEGGIAFALAEMAIASGSGLEASVAAIPVGRTDARLFGEVPGYVIVAHAPGRAKDVEANLEGVVTYRALGKAVAGSDRLIVSDSQNVVIDALVGDLRQNYERAIPTALES